MAVELVEEAKTDWSRAESNASPRGRSSMTMRRANSTRLIIPIVLLGLLTSQPGLASPRCLESSVSQRLKGSTAVFTGEALAVGPVEHFLETRFKVLEAFKGTTVATELRVRTYHSNSPEAPKFEPGRTYLVFAHGRGGNLMAGACAGTVEIRYAKQAISELRRLTRNRKG